MLYLAAFLVFFFDIAVGSSIQILGGTGIFLPAIVVLAGISGDWRTWLVWLITYLATGFFQPITILTLLAILGCSFLLRVLLSRWMSLEDVIISRLAIGGVIAFLVLAVSFTPRQPLTLAILGSFILTLPVIFLWFWLNPPSERRLK